jgi:hypothetical protein
MVQFGSSAPTIDLGLLLNYPALRILFVCSSYYGFQDALSLLRSFELGRAPLSVLFFNLQSAMNVAASKSLWAELGLPCTAIMKS